MRVTAGQGDRDPTGREAGRALAAGESCGDGGVFKLFDTERGGARGEDGTLVD